MMVRVLQLILGAYFLFVGFTHFTLPAGLPEPMAWMYDLSPTLHYVSGIVEIAAGLVLVAAALLGRARDLAPYAAAALAATMVGAAAWHFQRGEVQNIGMNVVLGLLAAYVAFATWNRTAPHVADQLERS